MFHKLLEWLLLPLDLLFPQNAENVHTKELDD